MEGLYSDEVLNIKSQEKSRKYVGMFLISFPIDEPCYDQLAKKRLQEYHFDNLDKHDKLHIQSETLQLNLKTAVTILDHSSCMQVRES